MAGSFNRFICVGRLTRDPELRALSSGSTVCKFTLAVDRRTNSRENREADFFDISTWNRLAETCNTYLKKGMLVLVEGYIHIRTYEDNEGVKRKAVDVIANDMRMLDRPSGSNETPTHGTHAQDGDSRLPSAGTPRNDVAEDDPDEIPF